MYILAVAAMKYVIQFLKSFSWLPSVISGRLLTQCPPIFRV
jgi:hypothetical protein